MGDVVSLEAYRVGATLRRAAQRAPSHPSLKWEAGDGLAHRRAAEGVAACGLDISGVALPGTGLCPECFE